MYSTMKLVENMAKEVAKEIESKTREFYEFVLPPIDMIIKDDNVIITADMPGFEKKDIDVTLKGRILRIQACKERDAWLDISTDDKEDNHKTKDSNSTKYDADEIICAQRPSFIDKKMRLPVSVYGALKRINDEKTEKHNKTPSAKYENGILKVVIPTRKRSGIDIPIQ